MAKRKLDFDDEHQSKVARKKPKASAKPESAPRIHRARDIQALLVFYQDDTAQLRDGTVSRAIAVDRN